jgi:hypothetical protein
MDTVYRLVFSTPLTDSLNIAKVIKSGRMRWVGHVARMEEGRGFREARREETTGKT